WPGRVPSTDMPGGRQKLPPWQGAFGPGLWAELDRGANACERENGVLKHAAIALERPLLVKGEPGTGKTVLAIEIAKALGAPLLEWHIKSTTKAMQGLYEYDAVTRLRDSQLGDARVKDIRNYIRRGKLWEAFVADERPVLL